MVKSERVVNRDMDERELVYLYYLGRDWVEIHWTTRRNVFLLSR
jgi:hypothetical protein